MRLALAAEERCGAFRESSCKRRLVVDSKESRGQKSGSLRNPSLR